MKKLILLILLALSGVKSIYSQNAFSDAILISKNAETYIQNIEMLLKPGFQGQFNKRQIEELKSLLQFLKNPWDDNIENLNFKIVLEVSGIVSGFTQLIQKYTDEIAAFTADLNIKTEELKVKENYLKTVTDSLEKVVTESQIKILTEEKKNLEKNLTDSKNNLDDIKKLVTQKSIYDVFNNNLKEGSDPISTLGKDNETEVAQTVSNANFSLSQAAIIEALGNAIIEQVKEGVVNAVFEGILERNYNLSNIYLDSKIPDYASKVKVIDTVSYKNGKETLRFSEELKKGNKDYNFSFEEYVREHDSILYVTVFDSSGTVIHRNFTVANNTMLKDELRIFFPRTIEILEKLKKSNTNNYFTNLNITLKNSFSEDLKNMLNNITDENNLRKSRIFGEYFYDKSGNRTRAFDYLFLASALINNIKNGFHPVEILPVFEEFLQNSGDLGKYAGYISMINILQKNLRDVSQNSKNIWVNVSSLADLNTKPVPGSSYTSAEYFLGILYQSDRTTFEFLKKNFLSDGKLITEKFKDFRKDLSSFTVIIRSVESNVNELTKGNKSFNDYVLYLNNFISLLDSSENLVGKYFFDPKTDSLYKNYVSEFRKYISYTSGIYMCITNGTYSKILPIALDMFGEQFKSAENDIGFKNEVIRYTNLYVDISTASSQDELNLAVTKAANNSGGYLRKSESVFNISVDSYPGITLNSENINNADGKFNLGFSVPLGFNFQLKHFGIFLQAFDIAAAVNYRFSSDSTTNLPSDVTFQQVFSPGVFIVINPWPTIPVSFNLGLSVTPALREVSGSGITLNNSKSTFYGVNFSYNVPLWYLYSGGNN